MSLPKKYAKLGFKEGWKAFKKSKNKSTRRTTKMGRKRTSVKKSYKRASKKSMTILGVNVMSDMLIPAGYGALRVDIAKFITPYTNKLPVINTLGDNADEVGMILALALSSKFIGKKVPLIRDLARAGIRIESAQLGQSLRLGNFGSSVNTTNSFR